MKKNQINILFCLTKKKLNVYLSVIWDDMTIKKNVLSKSMLNYTLILSNRYNFIKTNKISDLYENKFFLVE